MFGLRGLTGKSSRQKFVASQILIEILSAFGQNKIPGGVYYYSKKLKLI